MKILVADDSRVMRQVIIRTLRQAGYDGHDIVEAQNGRDAVAKAASEAPDLVLCDWHLPEMSGIQCLETLRSAGSTVPFGFITSDVFPEMRQEAAAAGAGFLLAKPFDEQMLKAAVEALLDPAAAAAVAGNGPAPAHPAAAPAAGGALPTAKDVRDMLIALLGRMVTIAPGRRVTPSSDQPASLATYVDQHGTVVAVCLMDLPLSACVAGALALLPPGGVQDAIEEGDLGPVLLESLLVVANVLAGPLSAAGTRARLHRLHSPGDHLSDELLVMTTGFERLDVVAEVSGYGAGQLSLVRQCLTRRPRHAG